MIDPKLNLRVSRRTPLRVYELGSELTKAGLGFPQYSNDDVVINGLIDLGYEPQDAQDYAVAACWEIIIPKVGADVANIGAISFPKVIDICLHRDLPDCEDFEGFLHRIMEEIGTQCSQICNGIKALHHIGVGLLDNMLTANI